MNWIDERNKPNKPKTMTTSIKFKRVNNDVYGNPRYVFHFLELANDYDEAHKLAKSIGASKYRGKDYGGGFVIQSYSLPHTEADIQEVSTNL